MTADAVVAPLLPVFAVILLGCVLKRCRKVADAFWEPAEALTFYVFFPALLVTSTAAARLNGTEVIPMLAALTSAILLVVALTFAIRRPLRLDGPAFTSLIQGAVRPNVYVGLAAGQALLGREGVALFGVAVAVCIPLVNAISVLALLRWAVPQQARLGVRALLLPLIGNPLILACLAGLTLNASGFGVPQLVRPLLEILGKAALPIGLLAVGAGLELDAVRSAGRTVLTASAFKLLLLPTVALVVCVALGVGDSERTVAVLYAALPCSASAYVMARQMGGDVPIITGVITATTLAAMASMPATMALVG